MFYFFDELTSTIDEARDPKYVHGDVVAADFQTAGRGQRGNRWSSTAGENLMFSVVLDSSFLRVTEQFLLLQTVALALTDTFSDYGIDARIKWTNDIYVGDRKITGVLIDHSLGLGGMLSRSGVGVGINVNQREFEPWLPNPTSMALELERSMAREPECALDRREVLERREVLDRREVLERFYGRLMERVECLKGGGRATILADYHAKIYRLDTPARFALPDGGEFVGTIRGVGPGGELTIDHPDGTAKSFLFREVSFII
ncbi:MAG: biotin--[acetyl-CoA-carboxylase] ligase [Alistipes sp.]|jgi:BirA family biotin operon repressor/biotin-[acetyl-CoA-carboxylase] ligase|nr:biotin--[acetyl-CoA-carboxylase] ligase [Alistipes sp.]